MKKKRRRRLRNLVSRSRTGRAAKPPTREGALRLRRAAWAAAEPQHAGVGETLQQPAPEARPRAHRAVSGLSKWTSASAAARLRCDATSARLHGCDRPLAPTEGARVTTHSRGRPGQQRRRRSGVAASGRVRRRPTGCSCAREQQLDTGSRGGQAAVSADRSSSSDGLELRAVLSANGVLSRRRRN